MSGPATRTQVDVVCHTHWDREWYEPHQRFRLKLVEVVEQVLDMIEADPRFIFMLDGQVAAVADFLELRPEAAVRVRRHVQAGNLLIGPWRILSDEFLVSGETLVRNLAQGAASAAPLGGAMPVGYLPDMFGHVAQMPQILARAGIADAVVYRGVPRAVDRPAFTWDAPDGSRVRACYLLAGGYGNASYLFAHADGVPQAAARLHAKVRPFTGDDPVVLAMHGSDHTAPRRDLMALVDRANAASDAHELRVVGLPAHLRTARAFDGDLPLQVGELRSAARANMLVGVTSTHVEVKAAAGRAERALERYAEPLAALHGDGWPAAELDLAWGWVVESSAHDSIPTCSHDETVAKVASRYAEAAQVGEGLVARILRQPAADVPRDGVVVWNPSPFPRTDEVVLEVSRGRAAVRSAEGVITPAQRVAAGPELLLDRVDTRLVAEQLISQRHDRELFGQQIVGFSIDGRAEPPELHVQVNAKPDPPDLDIDAIAAQALGRIAEVGGNRWRTVIHAAPRERIRARVAVPPLSVTSVVAVEAEAPPMERPVSVDGWRLANALIAVEVADDGTLTVTGDGVRLEGVGALVDGGDAGDTYNHAPPADDVVVREPDQVVVETLATGPLAASVRITRTYALPVGLDPSRTARRPETADVRIVTDVEVRADEPFVRVSGRYDNIVRDHRLRLHVPLPAPTTRSRACGHFAIVDRDGLVEGGHGEAPLATYPAHDLVAVDGVAALLDHVTEYEVVARDEGGSDLALTLLRTTRRVSENLNASRPEPAGPQLDVPGNQLLGERTFTLALRPLASADDLSEVLVHAERYRLPFAVQPGTSDKDAGSASAPGFALEGQGIALSALRRRDDALEVRLVALTDAPTTATLRGGFMQAADATILGEPDADPAGPLRVEAGAVKVGLGPWQIRTLHLH